MAFVGNLPWHGLGFQLRQGATIEEWTHAAGLAWSAVKSTVRYAAQDGDATRVLDFPDKVVVFRDDTFKPLSVMTKNYKVHQPKDILDMFRGLTESMGFEMETAGSLYGGRRIWALAKTGKDFKLPGGDEVRGYLLVATSYDGSLRTIGKFTSIRVVCNNTLGFAMADGEKKSGLTHMQTFSANKLKDQLGLVDKSWEHFSEFAKESAKLRPTKDMVGEFLVKVFGDPKATADDQPKRVFKQVWDAVTNSPGAAMKSSDGTAWGLLNGVTYYVDHVMGNKQDTRLDSAWFGRGEAYKSKSMVIIDEWMRVDANERELVPAAAVSDIFPNL
jgi:phage/plasmid-like protein (TIGR03299 family)